jgi:hypothetical protein
MILVLSSAHDCARVDFSDSCIPLSSCFENGVGSTEGCMCVVEGRARICYRCAKEIQNDVWSTSYSQKHSEMGGAVQGNWQCEETDKSRVATHVTE